LKATATNRPATGSSGLRGYQGAGSKWDTRSTAEALDLCSKAGRSWAKLGEAGRSWAKLQLWALELLTDQSSMVVEGVKLRPGMPSEERKSKRNLKKVQCFFKANRKGHCNALHFFNTKSSKLVGYWDAPGMHTSFLLS